MRIRAFCKVIKDRELEPFTLKDCTVVIDGQNMLFPMYKHSDLPYKFGCESDKYAAYLRRYLQMFKDANVKCYFIFKGGHKETQKKINRLNQESVHNYDIVNPIFMKEIYKQVLDEMGFEYTISEFESKEDIIAFAHKFNYPVISFDIEYCFSPITYIPHDDDCFEKTDDGLKVGVFKRDNFLKKNHLTLDKLAIFITLTDQNIFEENTFSPLLDSLNIPKSNYRRLRSLLLWLSRVDFQKALSIIYRYVNKAEFQSKLENTIKFINKKAPESSIPVNYLEKRNIFQITEKDPDWFKKGVALGHIPIPYINLYHSNIIFGSWAMESENSNDSMLFSIEIIKYAYNLLTNFTKSEFLFNDKTGNTINISALIHPSHKPDYAELSSPFENGWNRLNTLRLFEHFLEKSLQGFNYESLEKIPEDARLLMISLIYFSRLKPIETENIVCCVIMSYIMLAIVSDKLDESCRSVSSDSATSCRPYLDPTTDQCSVTKNDCAIANHILERYIKVTKSETDAIYDENLIHPLVEFQHCFAQFNYLNKLCGTPYVPTIYSKTYNGTFVYKLLYAIEDDNSTKGADFINKLINPAPTVLSFFNGMFNTYKEIMYT